MEFTAILYTKGNITRTVGDDICEEPILLYRNLLVNIYSAAATIRRPGIIAEADSTHTRPSLLGRKYNILSMETRFALLCVLSSDQCSLNTFYNVFAQYLHREMRIHLQFQK